MWEGGLGQEKGDKKNKNEIKPIFPLGEPPDSPDRAVGAAGVFQEGGSKYRLEYRSGMEMKEYPYSRAILHWGMDSLVSLLDFMKNDGGEI